MRGTAVRGDVGEKRLQRRRTPGRAAHTDHGDASGGLTRLDSLFPFQGAGVLSVSSQALP